MCACACSIAAESTKVKVKDLQPIRKQKKKGRFDTIIITQFIEFSVVRLSVGAFVVSYE